MRILGLIITFWLAIIALPTNSFALGLGEIEVNSFLNQPLNAEIEVISARAGEIDDLLVTLASRDAFQRAGLSRPRHLIELKFAVKKSEDDDSAVVLVTTKSAVKEPFLNFLVEADWSKGRVLREFTVLLDPPFYADTAAPAESVSQSPTTQSQLATPQPEPTPPPTSSTKPIVEDIASSEPAGTMEASTSSVESSEQTISEPIALSDASDSGIESQATESTAVEPDTMAAVEKLVEKGDTLWSFASQFKDSEHSMGQVMLAIQRMNPEAFNNNNINNLKIGAVLRAPVAEQLDRISKREAYAEVLVQNGLWDDYVARVTGSSPVSMASDGGTSGDSVDSSSDLGDLSLLAPGDGDSDAAGLQSDGENADELSRQLALAEEELEASKVENSELESRIAELEATLSKVQELQKMIEIEDDSLAQLQADQAAEAAEAAVTTEEAAAAEKAQAELTAAAEQAEAEQIATEQAEAEQAAAEQAEAEQAVLEQAIEAAQQTEEAIETTTEEEEALLDELLAQEATAEVVEEQTNITPPAPVIITEPVQESEEILDVVIGILDLLPSMGGILADPIMLGAFGGIVVMLLVLIWYRRRKASDIDDDELAASVSDDLFGGEEEFTPIRLPSEGETDINVPVAEDLEDNAADLAANDLVSQTEVAGTPPQEAGAVEQDDTLNEVDVYLAYGLYDNAEDLLQQSLEAHPERADYRSKLLDTYFATKNVAKFSSEAETLKSMGTAANPYWSRVQTMGYELAPDNPLFSGGKDSDISTADFEMTKPEAADFDIGADEDNTNFSTTDFNLGEETGEFTDAQNFLDTVVREDDKSEMQEETQARSDLENLPDANDLKADPEELDFSFDSEAQDAPADDDAIAFDLPEDIGSGVDDSAAATPEAESEELDFLFDSEVQEAPADDGGIDFDLPENDATSAALEGELDDLDFAADSEAEAQEAPGDDGGIDFELPEDDMDLVDDDSASAVSEGDLDDLDFTVDSGVEAQEEAVNDDMEATALVSMVDEFDEGTAFDLDAIDDFTQTSNDIDLGMDDTSVEDDGDIEATAVTATIDEDIGDPGIDLALDSEEDIAAMEIDFGNEPAKTDTFAPGDFDDPEELIASETDIEDIDDLMLPDDVDEVGTKLDLARAFIDMGDTEGARSSLDEVLNEGNESQKAEATEIIKHL